jgi:SAM-dependent methyltransferase
MMKQFDAAEVARFENATWSRCAENYMNGFGVLTSEAVGPLLDKVQVRSGERVLDLGTGPGLLAAEAAQRGAEVVGIDFSGAMVTWARMRHPRIEFRAESAESLPFDDKYFDVVAGNFVLHHSGCPEKVLAEAFRVLRPEGRMGFTIWADPAKLEAFGLFFAAIEQHAGAAELPHGPLFGVSDFAVFHSMIRDADFRESSVEELDIAWKMDSLDPYVVAFRDWANLDAFPKNVQSAIEATVRENALSYRSNGTIIIPNPAILLSGIKKEADAA